MQRFERRTGVGAGEAGGGRAWSALAAGLVCAGLIGGTVSPAWSATPEGNEEAAGEVELGSFAIGDGLEGAIGELDGSFAFSLGVGGVTLAWDSRAVGVDAARLGGGWSFGLARVRVQGGVWVFPASGGAYEADASVPSGLAGYPGSDVVFEPAEPRGTVPGRADRLTTERPYAYVLHELGGVSSYFDESGMPVVRVSADGQRTDWLWEHGSERLVGVVSPDGAATGLDWSDPGRVVIVPGSNVVDPVAESGVGGRWVVELSDGRVSAVVDPIGGRVAVGSDPSGLVTRLAAPSGAVTEVGWQNATDGVARVDRVRVIDGATGAELSAREWGVSGDVALSGWPIVSTTASSSLADLRTSFETWVSDGASRVESVVDGAGRMTSRSMVVSSSSGEWVLQEQSFDYPELAHPIASGADVRPTAASTTYRDARGGSRSVSETYEFDEFGRMVSRAAVDGTVTRRVYDREVPSGRALPVGLVVEETTTAADGLVASIRSELSADRAAVVVTEQWSGRAGEEPVRTGRLESDVAAGFVTEQRAYPAADRGAVPVVSRWSKHVDLAAGTKTIVAAVAVGTASEASTESVSSVVHGAMLSETDEVGNVTIASYDHTGRQTSVVDAAGRELITAYRSRQSDGVNAITKTDASGVSTTEELDALGRVVTTSDDVGPDGHAAEGYVRTIESREHGPGVERVVDAWGAVTTTERDVLGRTTRVSLPGGVMQVAEFDDVAGTATSGVSLTGDLADALITSTNVLDASGRVVATSGTRSDGLVVPSTETEFDGLGREQYSNDGSRSTRTEYDVFGNPVAAEITPLPATVPEVADDSVRADREFDGFGSSVEKTVRSGEDVASGPRRALDELGRTVSHTDQHGVTERTRYTPDGLVAEVVSDTGKTTRHEYDQVTRKLIRTQVSAEGVPTVTASLRYDRAGRLAAVFDPADEAGTVIEYEHDDLGNVVRVRYPDGAELRHEYDPHGRRSATIDVDGHRTEYAYDAVDGSLTGVAQVDRAGRPTSEVRYVYDEYRRANVVERGNGVRTEYTFTSAADIASELTTGPDGATLSEREYEYSPNGTLTSRIDRVHNDSTADLTVTRTDYEYDGHDRLVGSSVRAGDGPFGHLLSRTAYEPTVGGDLASETTTTGDSELTSTRRFEYSATGELVAITTDEARLTQTYDADGNLTESATGARYEYDAAGRQIAHTTPDGVRIQTTYWADGARRERATPAGSTRYYWDGDQLINDRHRTTEGEGGTASYLIGANRLARTTTPEGGTGAVSYYGTDRHGSIVDLTDQSGRVTTTYAYTDYGSATVAGDPRHGTGTPGGVGELDYNPFQYSGEYTHDDGSQPLGRRVYDPSQARFMTRDDAPLANLYAYTDLNPITYSDPSGRFAAEDLHQLAAQVAGIVLAVAGAALFLTTAGPVFTVLGTLGFVTAIGDAVLATVEVVESQIDDKFFPDDDLTIATWAFFGASALLAGGGVVAKLVTSRKIMRGCLAVVPCAGVRSTKGYRTLRGSSSSSSDSGEEFTGDTQPSSMPLRRAHERSITSWSALLERENIELLQVLAVGVGGKTAKGHMRLAKTHLVNARDVARRQMALGFGDEIEQATIDANYSEMRKSLNAAFTELDGATIELPLLMDYSKRRGFAASQAYPTVRAMYVNLRKQGTWRVSSSSSTLDADF